MICLRVLREYSLFVRVCAIDVGARSLAYLVLAHSIYFNCQAVERLFVGFCAAWICMSARACLFLVFGCFFWVSLRFFSVFYVSERGL